MLSFQCHDRYKPRCAVEYFTPVGTPGAHGACQWPRTPACLPAHRADVPTLVMIIPGVKDVVKTLQSAPVAAKKAIDNVQGDVQRAVQGIEDKGLGVGWLPFQICIVPFGGWQYGYIAGLGGNRRAGWRLGVLLCNCFGSLLTVLTCGHLPGMCAARQSHSQARHVAAAFCSACRR